MADALRSAAPQGHPGRRQGWARRETRTPNLLMWLHLEDVYWTERGRHSVHVVLAVAAVGGLILLGADFWLDVATAVGRAFARL